MKHETRYQRDKRIHGAAGSVWMRKRAGKRQRLRVRKGWKWVPHGASDMMPCRCITHVAYGLAAASFEWRHDAKSDRYRMRCLACGRTWSRARRHLAKTFQLELDGSHPEERKARRARLAAHRTNA